MKNLKFPLAVLIATKDVASNNPSFSVHDVTKKLRAMVNAGELSFTDRAQEDVDGINTFRVTHDDVKDSFNEIWSNDVVALNRIHGNGGYFLYELSQPVAASNRQALGLPTQSSPIYFDGNKPVHAVVTKRVSTPVPATLTPAATPLSFAKEVEAYLMKRGMQGVTMKEIQSRFKGVSKTCAEYAKIVESLGHLIIKNQAKYASTWIVG